MAVDIESLERDQISTVENVYNRKYRLRNVSNKRNNKRYNNNKRNSCS